MEPAFSSVSGCLPTISIVGIEKQHPGPVVFLSLVFIFSLMPYLFSRLGWGELTARNLPHITLPPFPSVSPANPAPTEERKLMPSNWYKGTFCFYATHAKRRGKKEGGRKKPTDVKIGKRSFQQQWSWIILAPSPPHFLLEVSHRPGPNSRALGGHSCWSEKNRPWRLEVTLKGHLIHHFV